jgi:hypothetical protein
MADIAQHAEGSVEYRRARSLAALAAGTDSLVIGHRFEHNRLVGA